MATTSTTTTTNSDGTTTTVTIEYDDTGNEISRTTSTSAGPGSTVGIQAGRVEGVVVVNGKRR